MARPSANSYNFGKAVFKNFGLGNKNLCAASLVSVISAIFAATAFYLPSLAAAISMILPIILGGLAFISISLLCGLRLEGLVFGMVVGALVGLLTSVTCASLIYISPVTTALLALPNVIAAVAYGIGGICSFFESGVDAVRSRSTFENNNDNFVGGSSRAYQYKPTTQCVFSYGSTAPENFRKDVHYRQLFPGAGYSASQSSVINPSQRSSTYKSFDAEFSSLDADFSSDVPRY